MKNPFKVGDLVKLRPDVLVRHSRSIPAHVGFTKNEFSWRDTLKRLVDKQGKITRVFPDSKHVNVEYQEPWTSKDERGRSYTVNSIGIDFTELVPFENPSFEEGVGYVYDKDMKKDPKHIKGKRWTVKYENEQDLNENKRISKSSVTESEIRNVIQELIKESDFYHPSDETDEIPEIPGAQKLSMMGSKPTISTSVSPPISKSNETPEQLRARLLASLHKKKIAETRETPDKNYIVFGKSGPITTYYTNSPTQGERMVQFGESMAYRFKTLEQVRNKMIELKNKYKGITNWDYEIVQSISPNPTNTITLASQPSITFSNRKGHTVSKPVKKGEEWFVRYSIDGKTDEGKSYYTNDKQDALDTYVYMLKTADAINQKLGIK